MTDNYDNSKPFALFDVDGVLVKPYVIERFPQYLVDLSPPRFSPDEWEIMKKQKEEYRVHGDYGRFAVEWVDTYARGIAGKPVELILELSEQFWESQWDNLVYNYSVELVQTLSEYCNVIAASGSPKEGLLPLMNRLGITTLHSTEVAIENGCFKNHIKVAGNGAVREAKDAVVLKYIDEITDTTIWDKSFAFGDTNHDGALLRYVGSPFLITDYDTEKEKIRASRTFNLLHYIRNLSWCWRPDDNAHIIAMVKMRLRTVGLLR